MIIADHHDFITDGRRTQIHPSRPPRTVHTVQLDGRLAERRAHVHSLLNLGRAKFTFAKGLVWLGTASWRRLDFVLDLKDGDWGRRHWDFAVELQFEGEEID